MHLLASLFVLFFGFYFQIKSNEWLWIILAISLVWITEAINTAIEKLVDFVSPDFDERAGAIKDLAAGAVLFAAIASVIIGSIVFGPYLL